MTATVPVKYVLPLLHQLSFGAQDESIKTLAPAPKYTAIERTQTEEVGKGSRHRPHIWRPIDSKRCGVANIRIEGTWDSAKLELGGQRFDKIYSFMDVNSFGITDGGAFLPFADYHEIHVDIEKPSDATCYLKYDIVEMPVVKETQDGARVYTAMQFTGDEEVKYSDSPSDRVIRLNFNHPIVTLHVKSEKPVENPRLFVGDHNMEIPLQPVNDSRTQWVLNFGESTANFSRIDLVTLRFKSEENTVRTYAVSKNVLRILCGMYGAAFSK